MNLPLFYAYIFINIGMLGHQERTALLLLIVVAIIVVAAHGVLTSMGKESFVVPLTDQSADGDLVRVDGVLEQVSLTRNGGHMNLVINNHSVFVPAPAGAGLELRKGDLVSVIGTIQTYHGKKEIVVSSREDIRINPLRKG